MKIKRVFLLPERGKFNMEGIEKIPYRNATNLELYDWGVYWDGISEELWNLVVKALNKGNPVWVGHFKNRRRPIEVLKKSFLGRLNGNITPVINFAYEMSFLSNMHRCNFELDSILWNSVEHWYQANKFEKGGKIYEEIANAKTPHIAKIIARENKIAMKKISRDKLIEIMKTGVYEKFTQNRNLLKLLLKTGERPLVEGNTWNDTFWGYDLKSGKGENILGSILEDIRAEFNV